MRDDSAVIITFRSAHDVMEAEERLEAVGIKPRLIPVPESASTDCSSAVSVAIERLADARAALSPMSERIGKWLIREGESVRTFD